MQEETMNIFFLEYAVFGIVLLAYGCHFLRTIALWKKGSRSSGRKYTGLKLHFW
jgi:hypothetical protein